MKKITYSRARVVLYLFTPFWMFLIPAFDANGSHFGWGTIPSFISILLLPILFIVFVVDIGFRVRDIIHDNYDSKLNLIISIGIPVILLILYFVVSFYYYS